MFELQYLKNNWDHDYAKNLNEYEKLKYRSNLLGSDLRITNFGGGNTSAKVLMKDPISNNDVEVLWVKGSGGDLGSIDLDGFSKLYMSKFSDLNKVYKGVEFEDDMVELYANADGYVLASPAYDVCITSLMKFFERKLRR